MKENQKNKGLVNSDPIELNKLVMIEAKANWDNNWVCGKLKSTCFIKMLEIYDFKFTDFLIVNLFTHILFNRTPLKDSKFNIKLLRMYISITKKEEDDLIKSGFKGSKHNKKIYKRIMKVYKNAMEQDIKNLNIIGMNQDTNIKEFIIKYLDEVLSVNTNEETILEEILESAEKRVPSLFVYCYLVSVYMNYEECLKSVFVYGEVMDGELKQLIQDEFISQISLFITRATNKNLDKDVFDEFGIGLAINIIDNEKVQLQNDKSIYTKKYMESIAESVKLQEQIKELKEELDFYKDLYKNKLNSKRILLIGDKKKECEYKEIIESFGGEMYMYDSFNDFSKINDAALNSFDYIVHFTYYTSHSVSNKINKYSSKLLFVNSSSKLELKKVLLSI